MGLFSAEIEGGVPDKSMASIPMGAAAPKVKGHTGPGFLARKNLAQRQREGKGIADAFKAGIAPAGSRLEQATIKRGMTDFDEKATLAGKKAKFASSRSGMYGSSAMADEMGRRHRDNARARANITASGMQAGRKLRGTMGEDYSTMRTRAEKGELGSSPAYAFGLPTRSAYSGPIVGKGLKTYTTTKKKEVKKADPPEEGGGGSGEHGGSVGEGERAG